MENKKIHQAKQPNQLAEKQVLAQNIAFFRKKLNLSQTELAKELKYSNKNISKWETGETTPDIFTLKKLAKIFNISLDTLVNPITNESKEAIKTKTVVPLKWKIYMLLLVHAIIFLSACILFFVLTSLKIESFNPTHIFLYILPLIDLSIFVFICCVKKKVDVISLSLFGWLIILIFYISFINYPNIAYIFFIAIGYQVLAPILANLINSGKIIKFNKIIIKRIKQK